MNDSKQTPALEEQFLQHFPAGTVIDDRTKEILRRNPESIELPEDITSPPFISRSRKPDTPREKLLEAIFGKR